MEFKILNFNKIENQLRNEYYGEKLTITDYWQWYTTGIESLINDQEFVMTQRYDNERSEILAYNFYENEAVADLLVLINNDNFLWDAPADFDLLWDITDNKMKYLEDQNKIAFNEDQKNYWREKMEAKVSSTNSIQSKIVIPDRSYLQRVIRNVNEYLEGREVK